MIKRCVLCGKEFECKGRRNRCYDKHVKICPICGKEFEIFDNLSPHSTCNNPNCKAAHMRKPQLTKLCKQCNEPFQPLAAHDLFCSKCRVKTCVICGKPFSHVIMNDTKTCGDMKCVQAYREQVNMKRYGVKNAACSDVVKETTRQHNIEKYGASNPLKVPELFEQFKQKCIENHGEFRFNSSASRDKAKSTMISRYGGAGTFACEELRDKAVATMISRYGVPTCISDGHATVQTIPYRPISKVNISFGKSLNEFNIPFKFEKSLKSVSYDIEILDRNILIEIDPTVTHNSYMDIFDKSSHGKPSDYHQIKSQLALDHGYRCIHIFDWDSKDKIIALLTSKQTIYARKCELRKVKNTQDIRTFLDSYHLQGFVKGIKHCYGLYYNNQLVELMAFGSPRYNFRYQFELLRLCSHTNYKVVGGAERLFNAFIKEIHPDSIISYCDLSKFSGEVYSRLGMSNVSFTPPAKVWSKEHDYITDNLLRQRGYDQLFRTNYGKGTSNEQLMLEHGWLPVYDCGQAVYSWRSSQSA